MDFCSQEDDCWQIGGRLNLGTNTRLRPCKNQEEIIVSMLIALGYFFIFPSFDELSQFLNARFSCSSLFARENHGWSHRPIFHAMSLDVRSSHKNSVVYDPLETRVVLHTSTLCAGSHITTHQNSHLHNRLTIVAP